MGCDGGSIPKRTEMVKQKQKQEIPDAYIQLLAKWTCCTLSKQQLHQPIVCDLLGKMYNKDSLLEYLLDKSTFGDADILCPHITSLKDVITIKLTDSPKSSNRTVIASNIKESKNETKWICPITGKEMNGKSKFVVLWKCGCVMAQEALDTIQTNTCLVCAKEFVKEDVVVLNPVGKDQEIAQERLDSFLEKKRAGKKKKRKADVVAPLLQNSSDEERKKNQSGSDKERKITNSNISGSDERKMTNANINMELPDLSAALNKKHKSKAVASLFAKDEEREKKQNFLTRGVFNRYVAH